MSRFNLAWLIAVPLAMLAGVSLSFTAPSRQPDKEYKLVRTVVDVLAEVDQHFVRPLDDEQKQKLVEDMINGGLDRLDPYSQYMNPDEFRQFNAGTEGNFGGVGIHLGMDPRTGLLMVISPMVGTPAHEAGILAGDLIIKIDDKTTEGMHIPDAVRLIQGEPGTKISLTVVHEGTRQPETYTMNRAMIEVQTVLGLSRREDNPRVRVVRGQGPRDRLRPRHPVHRAHVRRPEEGGRAAPGRGGQGTGDRPARQPRRAVEVGRRGERPVPAGRADREHQGPQRGGQELGREGGRDSVRAGGRPPDCRARQQE